jgi:crotonobetainyl-CoA:carnitine CoA-transferase CaiB-like acyl-CoA transferase
MAPALGAHTREVLPESGFSQEEIEELEAQGVVHQAKRGSK